MGMKIELVDVTSMMSAFGMNIGDVCDVVKELKNEKGDTYKYIIKCPKTNTNIGVRQYMAKVI